MSKMLKRSLIILLVVVLVSAGGFSLWRQFLGAENVVPPQLVAVKRGMFIHEILGRGSVDSAVNTEVRCRVENAGQAGLVIVSVVQEGTLVKEDDLLVELESSQLSENVERQLVTVISSRSRLDQSRAELENAKLTLEEYLEGSYIQQEQTIDNEIYSASEQVRTQEDQLVHYKRLLERNYITDAQVEAALIEYEKAVSALEMARLKLEVLRTLTKTKMVNQYEAAIATALSKVEADEQTLKIDENRLAHLRRQLENCFIKAPSDGQVVYYMPRWGGDDNLVREGMRVIDKQVLILLPDPTQMQVKGLVNEANVRFVKPGQKATIRLEAFLNQEFEGVVRMVNPYPEQAGFMGGGTMSREYLTTVKILNPPEGIKTGLTAEARIVVEEASDALLLPRQAVFEHGRKTYALTYKAGKWDKVEVEVGPTNDKEVVILSGLDEGDVVVLGAWIHRDQVELPKLEEEPRGERDLEDEELFREQMRQEELLMQQESSGGERRRERPAGGGAPGDASPGSGERGGPPGGGRQGGDRGDQPGGARQGGERGGPPGGGFGGGGGGPRP